MFDLEGFLALVEEMENKRKRSVELLRWQHMEDDLVRLRTRQKPGPKPRNKAPIGNGKPKVGSKPYTGSTPVRSAMDDEWRKRRRGGGGGGSAAVSAAGGIRGRELPDSAQHIATPGLRSAIASGSQPAVVKLISFASGRSRIGALLDYQSRGGEIAAEDDAGQRLEGGSWVQDIADEWSEEDGRQPSKDVLRLSVTVSGILAHDDATLGEMLPGHRIAWRR